MRIMCTVTSAACRPVRLRDRSRAPCGCCVPAQISTCRWRTHGRVQRFETARDSGMDRRTAARPPSRRRLNAASTSPSFRAACAGNFGAISAAFAAKASLLLAAAAPSSQMTFNFCRALLREPPGVRDDHHAARDRSARSGPSKTNACFTPGSALISSRFALVALPPYAGHF